MSVHVSEAACYSARKLKSDEQDWSAQMITLPENALERGRPHPQALEKALRQFEAGLPRLARLDHYYQGRHDILSRSRLSGLPNLRPVHGYPRYIAQVGAGYLLGEAVHVEGPRPQVSALRDVLLHGCEDSLDQRLALDQAIFGRAVSLCYEDAQGRPQVCALNPRNAFVVYDDSVAHVPLFGVYLEGEQPRRQLRVFTAQEVLLYAGGRLTQALPHPFGALPMTEYANGPDGRGDFEDVLPLVDAYDLLQADRMNDRAQFSNALLVLTGVMGLGVQGEDAGGVLELLRQEQTLTLPDSDAKAEWLVKTPQERDIEVLRQALAQDIHKFSMTPDFSDERFAGNASGIAIKYKLFNFENRMKLKERCFITGLRERARALCGWLKARQGVELDADTLSFRLSRSLPVNELERAQTIAQLKELLPLPTLRYNAPLQPDPNAHPEDCAGD